MIILTELKQRMVTYEKKCNEKKSNFILSNVFGMDNVGRIFMV